MTWRQRTRYRFDNLMARGIGAQILLLAVITLVLVVVAALAVVITGRPEGHKDDSFGLLIWASLMHSLDAGTLGGDPANWVFLFIMLGVTIGGIFVVSALIGVLNQGFGDLLDDLRRGKSAVVERGHTVILGWDARLFTLLSELAEANSNQRDACVVILADRDKVEMDAEIAAAMNGSRLRVVTRRGNSMTLEDLGLVALATSKAVIVLAPTRQPDGAEVSANESDTMVLKTLLAITKVNQDQALHIVAEIRDPRTEPVARMVVGERAALILAGPLVSRLLVQTGRQSGLSIVYTELLDFAGVEIYLTAQPELVGKTFREVVSAYDTSTVIGLRGQDGSIELPPSFDRRFEAGDQVVTISEDDDKIVLDGRPLDSDAAILPPPSADEPVAERTLVLGASSRLPIVLRELDAYAAEGSETVVVGTADPAEIVAEIDGALRHMKLTVHAGDVTDRGVLERLDVSSFDHVIVLSETDGRTQEMADARTTVTLLYLRDIQRNDPTKVPITSEILDVQNRTLAAVAEPDDFIVSNTLISLMVSQVAENPHLMGVFDKLFAHEGHELYLRPATDYVQAGELSFAAVSEAALRRGEIAIGYRLAASAKDAAQSFGVVLNPSKRSRVTLGAGDKVVVLADD
jgi:Trk K+ transport system NAD-binding subunit